MAWELRVPLRRVHGIRTSVPGYLERLSEPGDEPLPSVPAGRTVTVGSRHPSLALLDPFGGARVRPSEPSTSQLVTVARSGPWRVAVPARGACEAVEIRRQPLGTVGRWRRRTLPSPRLYAASDSCQSLNSSFSFCR